MHRFLITLPALVALACAPLASAATATATLPTPDSLAIPHQSFVLENGLTVVVHEDHSVPQVAVQVWYHVGSRNEERGRTGFAHLFEHFFFNGSEHHPHGFREAMDDLGANNRNGTTNTDRTNFFEDVPVGALERTLYLEADRMGWLAGNLSEAMLERERGVVQNEKRQGENRPYGKAWSRMLGALYPWAHPYSWSTIGSMEDLDAATLDDVANWYATWYGPNNAVLVLAGDITVERAKELVQRYFGPIEPGQPVARLQRWVPRLQANVRDRMQDRVPQSRIYRIWHLPPWGDRDLHAMELWASVLTGSDSSPLDRRLVFGKQLATSVGAFVISGELASRLVVYADVKPGEDAAAAEREIDAVVAGLLEQGPPAPDLERARARFLAGFAKRLEHLGGFGGRAAILAESATFGGDADAYLQRLRDLRELPEAELAAAAREWLGRPHYTLVVDPFPALAGAEDAIDRSQLPALDAAPDMAFPEMQRASLPNGLKVILMERHTAPLVEAALLVRAGSAVDPADARGTGRLALDLLEKGTHTRDAFAIADQADLLGASLYAWHDTDMSALGVDGLSANLAGSLDLLADVARNPAFPEDMVEIQRKAQLAAIGQEQADPFGMAFRLAPALLYGEAHPYGAPASGTGQPDAVAALPRSALVEWHRRWFRPDQATLVVAGDTSLEQLMPLVEASFGDWQASGPAPQRPAVDQVPERQAGMVYLVDRPGAAQSVIVAAHVTEPPGSPDDLALAAVMRNFGGMATSRLNRNLRLDKHWSYGASGFLEDQRGPRTFAVVAPVQTDRTADAMREVLMEIRGVAGERPVTGAEFESVMRNQVSTLAGRFDSLGALVSAATTVVAFGRDPAYYYDYARNLRALDEDDLARAAGRVIRPGELTWLVVGDLELIEEPVRALELGTVQRLQP